MAKQHRTGAGSKHVSDKADMVIRRDATKPGSHISTDQWVSRLPGRLPNTYGREQMDQRYHGGTLFFDHYSGYIHVHCQVSLRIGETLEGKHAFERFAKQYGVKLEHFRADNNPFNAEEWRADLESQDQTCSLSGVGAHHQNGTAERALQTVTYWARAMMMHQLLHWPDCFNANLWPFALEHAVHLWNHLRGTVTDSLLLSCSLERSNL